MTVTTTSSKAEVTGTGATDEAFGIKFPISEPGQLYVWTVQPNPDNDATTLTRVYAGIDFDFEAYSEVDDNGDYGKITWIGASYNGAIRLQRWRPITQGRTFDGDATSKEIERGLDDQVKSAQQFLGPSSTDYGSWDAENDRISNVDTPVGATDIANKEYVDDTIGATGGTASWGILAADVSRYLQATDTSGGYDWVDPSLIPAPAGDDNEYLMVNYAESAWVWQRITTIPAPCNGSSCANQLLMVDSSAATGVSLQTAYPLPDPDDADECQVLAAEDVTTPSAYWRNHGFMPTPLPAGDYHVATGAATGATCPIATWGKRVVFGKTSVAFVLDKDSGGNDIRAVFVDVDGGLTNNINDHRVYGGRMPNPISGATPEFMFFQPQLKHIGSWTYPSSGVAGGAGCAGDYAADIEDLYYTMLPSVGAVTSDWIELALTSPAHTNFRTQTADTLLPMWNNPGVINFSMDFYMIYPGV